MAGWDKKFELVFISQPGHWFWNFKAGASSQPRPGWSNYTGNSSLGRRRSGYCYIFYFSHVVETRTRYMVHLVILCLLYAPLTFVILFRKQLQWGKRKGLLIIDISQNQTFRELSSLKNMSIIFVIHCQNFQKWSVGGMRRWAWACRMFFSLQMTLMWVLLITSNVFAGWGLLSWHLKDFDFHIQEFEGKGQANKKRRIFYVLIQSLITYQKIKK